MGVKWGGIPSQLPLMSSATSGKFLLLTLFLKCKTELNKAPTSQGCCGN